MRQSSKEILLMHLCFKGNLKMQLNLHKKNYKDEASWKSPTDFASHFSTRDPSGQSWTSKQSIAAVS